MLKLLKIFAWMFLLIFLGAITWLALGPGNHATVTLNGRELHGAQKLVAGSAGLLAGAVAVLVALIITAMAIVGSGFLTFAILAFTALIMIAVVLPFLLPIVIPVILIAFLIVIAAKSNPAKSS